MKKAVMYGAGNIGRGFIGQLFSQSGYATVFIDVNKEIVNKLNSERAYPVRIILRDGYTNVEVKNVRAVDGNEMEGVAEEIKSADLMATAVGVNILPRIVKPVVQGLRERWSSGNLQPLNIIICENLIDADKYLARLIKNELDDDGQKLFDKTVGLVEASIGWMVPVMTPEMQDGNILRVCVEEYGELPVNKDAFIGEIPDIINMLPFSPFEFYIQRKLFIHNLGHAVTAYLGYLKGYRYIWEAIGDPFIKLVVLRAMQESSSALSLEHDIPLKSLLDHVDDLIYRFGNRGLGDTVDRVGKDPLRKLSPNDRLLGAANLCEEKGVNHVYISIGIAAAIYYNVNSTQSSSAGTDLFGTADIKRILESCCGLSLNSLIWNEIIEFYEIFCAGVNYEKVLDKAESLKNFGSVTSND